jgi:hypothetical protein
LTLLRPRVDLILLPCVWQALQGFMNSFCPCNMLSNLNTYWGYKQKLQKLQTQRLRRTPVRIKK